MDRPTKTEIRDVAKSAAAIFAKNGLTSALFGGAACEIYGCTRNPNDVDIIVMTDSYTTEYLKSLLVRDSTAEFYTRPSKKIGATYRLLFCRLPQTIFQITRRSCKVDILIPGIMNIPSIPSSRILRSSDGLPVLPFFVLLMLKVQGWSDHRKSDRSDYRAKQHQDVQDIGELLSIGKQRKEDWRRASGWVPQEFSQHGGALISEYVTARGGKAIWEELGFEFVSE